VKTLPFVLLAAPMIGLSTLTQVFVVVAICAGVVIRAVRSFDVGLEWFNRHFDIEKRPLKSIGFVAGAMAAVVYWAAVMVSRVI
jgi:hypothetical protein